MTVKEIDFKLVKDKIESKVFKFTNSDGTVYDMTDSTAKCFLYKTATPTEIVCTIDVVTGKITIPFTAAHSDTLGTFEYILEETKITTVVIPLVKGNIAILDYVPFSESIEAYLNSELPANLTLTMDYRNQRIMYWRRILQTAFAIADADLNIESAWPTLVNALLAKLVVYDALMLSASGAFAQFMGGDYTATDTIAGGAVKSVETGPARVEYMDASASAKNAFASTGGQPSMFQNILVGICGLANQLGVKVPMCAGNKIPIAPRVYQNPDWIIPTLDEIVDLSDEPSQG